MLCNCLTSCFLKISTILKDSYRISKALLCRLIYFGHAFWGYTVVAKVISNDFCLHLLETECSNISQFYLRDAWACNFESGHFRARLRRFRHSSAPFFV